jgi:predicted Zn-dependent protease
MLVFLPLAGCSALTGPGGGFNVISVDDEWEMGDQLEGEIEQQMKVLHNPGADAFLNQLGKQLLAASSNPLAQRPWKFHIVADDSVNAFNVPGGLVYVHTGLVASLDDYAEFSSVVAHEIGHGLSRHGTEQLSTQFGLSLLLSMVLGKNPSAAKQIVASFVSGGAIMKFSREDELEADRAGIYLMYGAGIDPQGTVDMLHVLDSLRDDNPSRLERFMSSHPMPEERISKAEDIVDGLPPKPNLIRTDSAFNAFKRRVAELN